jgi:serine/threonine protein kinase
MDYRILARLPSGGFSEIFEVEDAAGALPERLILKRLNAEMSALPAVRAAFAEEARMLRELRHPNVVTFRRCHFDPQQRVCLLMEKVEGEPLDAWVRRHSGASDPVLDLFDQVLGAVDYLHHRASPLLHLDLKPDNVLVAPSPEGPRPVLIDFGIARRAGGQGLKAYTPPYAAPEQVAGDLLGCATDVYALGQILEEILAVLRLPAPRLQAVATRAKSAALQRRHADAGEMRLALRRARREAPPVKEPPARRPLEPRRWARVAVTLSLVGLAMAGIVLLAVLWGGRSQEPTPSKPAAAHRPTSGEEIRRQFRTLQSRFEETVIDRHCSLSDPLYLAARDLSDTLPEPSEDGTWMKRELDDMRRTCQATEANGPESEAILAGLRQKHLAYTQP